MNEGQPVPDLNLSSDRKSGSPPTMLTYVPGRFSSQVSPVNARSVPAFRATSTCKGVSVLAISAMRSGDSGRRSCPAAETTVSGPAAAAEPPSAAQENEVMPKQAAAPANVFKMFMVIRTQLRNRV